MQVFGLILGILAILGMIVGFFPCLGALNWIVVPLAAFGLLISIIGVATAGDKPKGVGIAGLVLAAVALVLGFIRLVAGGGIL